MPDVNSIKQQEITDTPLFLFECRLKSGVVERWSTHAVTVNGNAYRARVLGHNLFELKSSLDDGADGAARISLTLANADSYFSEIEWNTGWKGARLSIQFLFFDLLANQSVTPPQVIFQGLANSPDEITDSTLRVTFTNRLNLQRVVLPEIRIQKRCPWLFPSTAAQRLEAVDGAAAGRYSPFFRCGYSADVSGGHGNLQSNGQPFTSCGYTREQCVERGMFDKDAAAAVTRRFGGIEFVPASVLVRSYGEKGSHLSTTVENETRYNDLTPLVYGTAWYQPPIVFARNDGNLTRMEVLLGAGEITGVVKVIVNDVEIPQGVDGANMTATGWYNLIGAGTRTGAFNSDFTDSSGQPAGDPYGSMATLSVVVPNRISNGQTLPRILVLAQGMKLARFDGSGINLGDAFTNNPAWVLLDVMRRCGWTLDELDLASFAATAAYCDAPVSIADIHGNAVVTPRYQCNLVIRRRRSAADIVRGIRSGSSILMGYAPNGLLQVRPETAIDLQHAVKSAGTNSAELLNGGWPAFEFSDGSAIFSGIARKDNGEPHLRLWARPISETPNRLSVEFQDEFNEYQQDSLSLVDVDDAINAGQEVSAGLTALGLPNFDQATRIARRQLNKFVHGNLYIEFGTSVRAFGLVPGDIIAVTYEKEGMVRQPFRIIRVAPGLNFRTAVITAQIHDDAWYSAAGVISGKGSRRQPAFGVGLPRPLVGPFSVTESTIESADGSLAVGLSVGFTAPSKAAASTIGIPLLSLSPLLQSTGGTIAGGQTLYYAISGVDAQGAESELSFTVKASIPAGSATNTVTLQNLSFSAATTAFNVYRGTTPAQLVRIVSAAAIAGQFIDMGFSLAQASGPPDENYDHANFYWRMEVQPETAATSGSTNTIVNSSLTMLVNEYRGLLVRITQGRGQGQERLITANSATTVTVSPSWDVQPDATSFFAVAESSWRFGALTAQGPAEFEAPNRAGATVQILGRAANVHDQECAAELSPLVRWRIGGADGGGDADVPPAPVFGLAPAGQGTIELGGVAFAGLTNTRTIASGTLGILYWDELSGAAPSLTGSAMAAQDTTVTLAAAGNAAPNDVIQAGRELMLVTAVGNGGTAYTVQRAAYGSPAAAYAAGTPVYRLSRRTWIVPFARDFFGSPASGSYNYSLYLPDVRVAAAELFVTNMAGNSPNTQVAFTLTADAGIRTLSGGQYSIQTDGVLAIQNDAAPPLIVEDTHAVRDIYAVLREASTNGDIQLRLKQDGADYCDLTIPGGTLISNVVDGFGLPALRAKAQLSVDIVSVPQDRSIFPGRDLTVTIRL